MSQWGNTDATSNSVLWSPAYVNKTVNTANRDALYGNVTIGAFVNDAITGVFGVSPAEVTANSGGLITIARVESGGLGYVNGALISFTNAPGDSGAGANVSLTTNSTGGITSLTISNSGSTPYKVAPTGMPFTRITTSVTVANGGGAVLGANLGTLTQNTTSVNAAISTTAGIVNNTWLAVYSNSTAFTLEQVNNVINATHIALRSNGAFANTTGATFAIATGNYNSLENNAVIFLGGGAGNTTPATVAVGTFANNGNGEITAVTISNQGNNYLTAPTLTVNSAAAGSGANLVPALAGVGGEVNFAISGGNRSGMNAGWNIRREGTGGRAGRVTYETLVAMRSIGSDASDDDILPDS
jgi:hypothetical protein